MINGKLQPLGCGKRVVIVNGKYARRTGYITKTTDMMYAVQLTPSNEVVRVWQRNVQRYSAGPPDDGIKPKQHECCVKPCCKARSEALKAARDGMIQMQERMDQLINMLEVKTAT
jgi:hypothetical protein